MSAVDIRAAAQEAIDLLAERRQGSPARSPGHNARLVLEAALAAPAIEAQPVAQFLPCEDGEFNGNLPDVETAAVGQILSFEPGYLRIARDGSGYFCVPDAELVFEDDRQEGPDGPEGSVHWIARMDASEIVALRDFLNLAHPSDAESLRGEVERLTAMLSNRDSQFHRLTAERDAALASVAEVEAQVQTEREENRWAYIQAAMEDHSLTPQPDAGLADRIEDLIAEFGADPANALAIVSEHLQLRRHNAATAQSVAQYGSEWDGDLTPEEQGMIDAAWEKHKAARPADAITALRSRPVGEVWQDIATAPKDGTRLFAWIDGLPAVVHWEVYDADLAEECGDTGYWSYSENLLADVAHSAEFEFWSPLLPAPRIRAALTEGDAG